MAPPKKLSDAKIRSALRTAHGNLRDAAAILGADYSTVCRRAKADPIASELIVRKRENAVLGKYPEQFLSGLREAVEQLSEEFLVESFPGLVRGVRLLLLAEQHGGTHEALQAMEEDLRRTDDLIKLARWHRTIIQEWADSG